MIDVSLHYSTFPVSRSQIKKICIAFGRVFPQYHRHEVSIAFVGNAVIRRLNKKYRHHDRVTDVLSFADQDVREHVPPRASLGEVIIAYPRACQQAKRNKHSVQEEIAVLLVHGLLHLAGYDHQTDKQYQSMERKARIVRRAFTRAPQKLSYVIHQYKTITEKFPVCI